MISYPDFLSAFYREYHENIQREFEDIYMQHSLSVEREYEEYVNTFLQIAIASKKLQVNWSKEGF